MKQTSQDKPRHDRTVEIEAWDNQELKFAAENKAKTSFDDVYTAPTPHHYIAMMARNGYEIGEQARPYCNAAVELLNEHSPAAWPVQMLDIGCSYGMGSSFVKHGCSFDEMVAFFSTRAPEEYGAACQAVRNWINATTVNHDLRCVGLDSSVPAIKFALESGLLDGAITSDLEDSKTIPTEEERAWLGSCNFVMSTGAIGYVTERTMEKVLHDLGSSHPSNFGPIGVFTVLRLFEVEQIRKAFEDAGYVFEKVPNIMLPQRKFTDKREQAEVLKVLHDRRIDTSKWEDLGKQYAELFICAKPEHFDAVLQKMQETHSSISGIKREITYIRR